ncbi:MAG: sigma-70 family RNA polymerase sigma factor [Spirochaetia bacterium]|nr:sigma-70 family RNA polymerase sigma factor [Spirochaetia bacterium]
MGNYDLSKELLVEKQWEGIYQDYNTILLGYLTKKTGYDLACDIMQEAFLKLYFAMRNGKKIENVKAYLFQIARNEMYSQANKVNLINNDDVSVKLEDFNSNVEADFDKKELNDLLASAKTTLSSVELEIFEMRWHLGFTQAEIAKVLHKSERQIRRNIEKIVRKIRIVFENAGWNPTDV